MTRSLFTRIDPEVFLVCTHHQGRDNALVATWVRSITLHEDRERVMVALSSGSLTGDLVRASHRFVVQLLSEGQEMLIPHFGLLSGRDIDKFDRAEMLRTYRGLPLVAGTCGWAECDVIAEMVTDERVVVIGRVVEEQADSDRRPLRLSQAFRVLPQDVFRAVETQRHKDGERDRP